MDWVAVYGSDQCPNHNNIVSVNQYNTTYFFANLKACLCFYMLTCVLDISQNYFFCHLVNLKSCKSPCISCIFFLKIQVKSWGCGLSKERSASEVGLLHL